MASPGGARRRSAPSTAPAVGRGGAADAAGARLGAGARAEPAAARVLGDVGGRDPVAAPEALAGGVAIAADQAAAVEPEESASARPGLVVAVAVLDDLVVLVHAVRGVVVPAAGGEREGQHGNRQERDVAGPVATALTHSAPFLVSWCTLRSASTTSGCETLVRSLSISPSSTLITGSISSSDLGVTSLPAALLLRRLNSTADDHGAGQQVHAGPAGRLRDERHCGPDQDMSTSTP